MKEGTRRRQEQGVPRQKQLQTRKGEIFLPIGGRHVSWTLPHPLRVLRWEESFQPPDERLQNIPKVTRRSGVKSRSTSRKYNHKSRISTAK
jgi:hypothetical protein